MLHPWSRQMATGSVQLARGRPAASHLNHARSLVRANGQACGPQGGETLGDKISTKRDLLQNWQICSDLTGTRLSTQVCPLQCFPSLGGLDGSYIGPTLRRGLPGTAKEIGMQIWPS